MLIHFEQKSHSTNIEIDRPITVSEPITIITDLNDQCLEFVFKRLTAQILVADQMVLVSGLQMCLQFLRCFGRYTSKLSIQFGDSSRRYVNYINQYVNKYCTESLVHITFNRASESLKRFLRKPYPNLKSIYITESRLIKQLPQFNCWFPNVQRLELVFNAVDKKHADAHFPNLQELRLFLVGRYRLRNTLIKYMTCLLAKNSHIKCLDIDIQVQPAAGELNIGDFLTSIKGCSAITTLRTTYGFGFHAMHLSDLIELIRRFPFLVELDLKPYQFGIDDAISFTNQQSLLKFFRFTINRASKLNYLKTRPDDKWQSSFSMDKWQSTVVTLKRLD